MSLKMKLNKYQIQVMNGLMLGDGHIHKSKTCKYPLYTQTFGQHGELFAKDVFKIFNDFCTPKGLYTYKVQSGKDSPFYQRFIVRTKTLKIFEKFYNMYYKLNDENKKIKILPSNIKSILTPIALAYFVMSDGNYHKTHKIIRLCTNNFTKEEVNLLSLTLLNKYNFNCRLEHVRKEQYILIIRNVQVTKFQQIVKSYMLPSMLYKIGL